MSIDPILAGTLFEAGKLGLQIFLINMKLAGKSPVEIDMEFSRLKAEFDIKQPENLKDV